MKGGDTVPLAELSKLEKITTKLEMVESARDMIAYIAPRNSLHRGTCTKVSRVLFLSEKELGRGLLKS